MTSHGDFDLGERPKKRRGIQAGILIRLYWPRPRPMTKGDPATGCGSTVRPVCHG
ncbi:hypothetical protein HOU02_gp081 [Caulobacter phage CcrBL9]|uniref:Uncharacterized protein n=1 Tax=Caulobacter phage CcrBL9 TaxID=2283270 RepID=A0A385EDM0_9CAUD|nr:hypothetical protein HOU02_gp081 [Caulobacter phage CcrBL9]AXQ69105.1 hypothetical protein CcrBL9_gp081c [Caulobacter phage CcrBL9]